MYLYPFEELAELLVLSRSEPVVGVERWLLKMLEPIPLDGRTPGYLGLGRLMLDREDVATRMKSRGFEIPQAWQSSGDISSKIASEKTAPNLDGLIGVHKSTITRQQARRAATATARQRWRAKAREYLQSDPNLSLRQIANMIAKDPRDNPPARNGKPYPAETIRKALNKLNKLD